MRYIRASMLPSYNDCARRTAAKQYRKDVEAHGFELRKLPPSIGAAVGTAVHKVVESILRGKMETGTPGTLDAGMEKGLASFREEIAPGAEWDATTPNSMAAEEQIKRLASAYLPRVPSVTPEAVELSLEVDSGGWAVTGHIDLLTAEGRVEDLKTGSIRRPYQAQLGAYSLLARSNGYEVKELGTLFIPRVRPKVPQPMPEWQAYPRGVSEAAAFSTIENIKRDMTAFLADGDPYHLPANPMSLVCSPRYCPAFGTSFCRLHLERPSAEIAD